MNHVELEYSKNESLYSVRDLLKDALVVSMIVISLDHTIGHFFGFCIFGGF